MANAVVIFHRLAGRDYRLALRRYAGYSPQTAIRFRTAVDQALQRIARSPQHGVVYHGRFRWVRTRRYPYVLYYEEIDPTLVRILAVAHGSRRPGYWMRRAGP
jgi:plasmid stabilization system protein ParE